MLKVVNPIYIFQFFLLCLLVTGCRYTRSELIRDLASGSRATADKAAKALIADELGAQDDLIQALRDSRNPILSNRILDILSVSNSKTLRAKLQKMLASKSADDHYAALAILIKRRDCADLTNQEEKYILSIFNDSKNESLMAFQCYIQDLSPSKKDFVALEFSKASGDEKIQLLRVIGSSGNRQLYSMIGQCFRSPDVNIRRAAVYAGMQLDEARTKSALQRLNPESDEALRKTIETFMKG